MTIPDIAGRLYVSDDFGLESFQRVVGDLIGVRPGRFGSMSVAGFGFDVGQNEDYDPRRLEQPSSSAHPAWLFYRWTLWIEAEAPDAKARDFIDLLATIVRAFRDRGADVVIAADFEDQIEAAAGTPASP